MTPASPAKISWLRRVLSLAAVMAIAVAILAAATATASAQQKTAAQRNFATPEAASAALVAALRAMNRNEVGAILGQSGRRLIETGDPVDDARRVERLVAAYEKKHELVADGGRRVKLMVGDDDWPFPIPLVRSGGGWRFDTEAGRKEIIARRVGQNELSTIEVMRAIVDAQREYAAVDRDGDGQLAYARRFASSPGTKDGLYWPTQAGEAPSPLGPLASAAWREGYRRAADRPTPFHGYLFRLLEAQGANAPGGAHDYVVRGKMIGGFAVVAYPVTYGESGVMTFLVSHDGVVHEKDLGPNTANLARNMKSFDPDPSWRTVAKD